MTTLKALDNGPGANVDETDENEDLDSQGNETPGKTVENSKGSSCCTIF